MLEYGKDYSIRKMTLSDLASVMAIEDLAFEHPWSADLFRRELQNEWSTILVAEKNDATILGFIIYWLVHDEVHILNIATDPSFRRQGIARILLKECVSICRQQAVSATLEVRRSNAGAIKLYESFGFRSVGIRPKYYAEEAEDAIVMTFFFD